MHTHLPDPVAAAGRADPTACLAAEVQRLQQQLRRQRQCVTLLACAVLSFGLLALTDDTPQPANHADRVIEGSSLRLTTDDGACWASLERDGRRSTLQLRDHNGHPRATIGVDEDGTPIISLRYAGPAGHLPAAGDATGNTLGLELSVLDNATPRVVVYDRKARERAKLLLMPNGTPMLLLKDEQETTRVEMLAQPQGLGGFVFFDEDRRLRGLLGYRPNAPVGLALIDALGRLRLELGLGDDATVGPFARMRDDDQQDIWSAPAAAE